MKKVFLSHSPSEQTIARRLATALRLHGLALDLGQREEPAGSALPEAIRTRIVTTDFFVYTVSIDSAGSERLDQELGVARRRHGDRALHTMLPIIVDEADVPVFSRHAHYLALIRSDKPHIFSQGVDELLKVMGVSRGVRELPDVRFYLDHGRLIGKLVTRLSFLEGYVDSAIYSDFLIASMRSEYASDHGAHTRRVIGAHLEIDQTVHELLVKLLEAIGRSGAALADSSQARIGELAEDLVHRVQFKGRQAFRDLDNCKAIQIGCSELSELLVQNRERSLVWLAQQSE